MNQPVTAGVDWIDNGDGITANLGGRWLRFGDIVLATPRLDLVEDLTDTWSHGVDRYPEAPQTAVAWSEPCVVESGPVMAALVQQGRLRALLGPGRVPRLQWGAVRRTAVAGALGRAVQGPEADAGRCRPASLAARDGVLGAAIERPLDGSERPLRDWTLLQGSEETRWPWSRRMCSPWMQRRSGCG